MWESPQFKIHVGSVASYISVGIINSLFTTTTLVSKSFAAGIHTAANEVNKTRESKAAQSSGPAPGAAAASWLVLDLF